MKTKWDLRCFLKGIIFLAICSLSRPGIGADIFWIANPNSSGDWFDVSNWSTPFVPGLNDFATIDNYGQAIIGAGSIGLSGLTMGELLAGNLSQTGGSVTVDNVSVSSASRYNLTGGSDPLLGN